MIRIISLNLYCDTYCIVRQGYRFTPTYNNSIISILQPTALFVDIKGMKEPSRVVEHQDAITEALRQYTESHFPQTPTKYGQLLMRLTELAKISMLTKEALNSIVPPSLQSCGLLFELLKGDTGKEDS